MFQRTHKWFHYKQWLKSDTSCVNLPKNMWVKFAPKWKIRNLKDTETPSHIDQRRAKLFPVPHFHSVMIHVCETDIDRLSIRRYDSKVCRHLRNLDTAIAASWTSTWRTKIAFAMFKHGIGLSFASRFSMPDLYNDLQSNISLILPEVSSHAKVFDRTT